LFSIEIEINVKKGGEDRWRGKKEAGEERKGNDTNEKMISSSSSSSSFDG